MKLISLSYLLSLNNCHADVKSSLLIFIRFIKLGISSISPNINDPAFTASGNLFVLDKIEGREPVIDVEPETPSGADDETQIREFVEKYIEVLTTGNTKFIEKNVDLKAMYLKDGEIYGEYGLSKKNSQEEYANLFNTQTLPLMRKGWDKTFEFESFELKGDEAHIKVKAIGAKRQDQPLILKKVSGKWKLIWIPMWGGF